MRIKHKILSSTSIIILIMTLLTMIVLSMIISDAFLKLEKESREKDISRIKEKLQEDVSVLTALSKDYAVWDDTYNFVLSPNEEYGAVSFSDDVPETLRIDYFIIADSNGEIIFVKSYDPLLRVIKNISADESRFFYSEKPLFFFRSQESYVSGIIDTPKGLMLFSSHPVLKSSGEGPVVGSLLMGRILGDSEIDLISQTTRLNFSVSHYTHDNLANLGVGFQEEKQLSNGEIVFFADDSKESVTHALIDDAHGDKSLILSLKSDRKIHTQSRKILMQFIYSLCIISIIIFIALFIIMDKFFIQRLLSIDSKIKEIYRKNDSSIRIDISGNDELSRLAASMNSALDSIERKNSKIRAIINANPDKIFHFDSCGNILEYKGEDCIVESSGKNLSDMFSKDFSSKILLAARESISDMHLTVVEHSEATDGRYYEVRIVPLPDSEFVMVVRDTTLKNKDSLYIKENEKDSEMFRSLAVERELKMNSLKEEFIALKKENASLKESLVRASGALDEKKSLSGENTKQSGSSKTFMLLFFVFLIFSIMFLSGCSSYTQLPEATLKLKWFDQAQFAGNYVAVDKGFYLRNGANVTLVSYYGGQEDENILRDVSEGKYSFGITGADELLIARSKGIPVKAVAVIYKRSPVCAYTLDKSITQPEDFLGKTVGIEKGINVEYIYNVVMSEMCIDRSMISERGIGADPQVLLDGTVDIATGYSINEPNILVAKGFDVNIIIFANYGADVYADVLFTSEKLLLENPELVDSVVSGTLDGWNYALHSTDESIDIVMNHSNGDRGHQELMFEQSVPLIFYDSSPLGIMDYDKWSRLLLMLQNNDLIDTHMNVNDAFTNAFVINYYDKNSDEDKTYLR